MSRLFASLRDALKTLHLLQHRLRQRLVKRTREILTDGLIRGGWRLGKWIDVQDPVAARKITVQVIHHGYELTVEDEEQCRFLQLQTTVPVQGRSVRRGDILVCTLDNAKLDVRAGMVCTEDDRLLLEAPWEVKRLKSSRTYGSRFPCSPRYLKGTYSTIWGNWTDNYYHWLVEYLPRLYSLKCAGSEPLVLLLPSTVSAFQKSVLETCLPDTMRVQYLENDEWIQAERFLFAPTVVAGTDFPLIPRDFFGYLRERIFRRFHLPEKHEPTKKIYISRDKAKTRRVRNEAAVVALLSAHGFDRYFLEDLSFEEQVRLFHQASIVVAPHGAGLTNLIFAGEIPVVELLGLQPVPVYFFLALSMGQQYHYLLSNEGKQLTRFARLEDYDTYREKIDADFTIDLASLAEAITRADNGGGRRMEP
jgi:hypothetical protein